MRGMRQMNRDMDAEEDGGPSTNCDGNWENWGADCTKENIMEASG